MVNYIASSSRDDALLRGRIRVDNTVLADVHFPHRGCKPDNRTRVAHNKETRPAVANGALRTRSDHS